MSLLKQSSSNLLSHRVTPCRSRQRGIGVLEVLIALIVISLGVLGMAGLQLTGMKHSTNGFNRAKAVMAAENMATRMRINRTGVVNFSYDGFDSSTVSCTTRPARYCQPFGTTAAQRCDSEQLATFDQFAVACGDWAADGASGGVAQLLPAGAKLEVDCDVASATDPCTEDSSYTLSVTWPERLNASSDDVSRNSRVQMRLRP